MPQINALEDFRCFQGITESWELVKTGLIVIRERMYKLELWHSFSNPDVSYYVAVYVQEEGVWRKMADPPFPVGMEADQTLRSAMAFLTEQLAA